MLIYVFIFLICLFGALAEQTMVTSIYSRYKHLHFYLFSSLTLFLFVVVAFRECGFDHDSYWVYFDELNNNSDWLAQGLEIGSEPGYSLLNYSLGTYATVITVMSAAILIIQFKFIWRYSKLPLLSVLFYLGLFMYPSTMGQFRQALAIGFVLWAIVNKQNKFRFLLLILLAMTFHISAILGLLALLVPEQIKSLRFYLIAFGGALLCSITAQALYTQFISTMPVYVASKLSYYATKEVVAIGLNSTVMLRAFIFFTCYNYRQRLSVIPYIGYFLNIYFLSLIIYTALGFAPQVAGRGSIYFSIFEIIVVANLIFTVKGVRKYAFLILFTGFSIYRQVSFFDQWGSSYIPYKSWFLDIF